MLIKFTSNRFTFIIAGILLTVMFFLAVFSMKEDSVTMDEVAHLPAGYSYLTQKDIRLNPEHPPLLKDLAAAPLLFIKEINFPSEIKDWTENINGQWGFGYHFLYHDGNPADEMIFLGRFPIILILILLGFFIFKWAREIFGNGVALLALFLFSFSPTFISHGRLVTTDVGAAAGIFIASYYFIKALQKPTKKNIIFSGVSFGLAELCKFSVILLIPFFIFLGLTWWLIKSGGLKQTLKSLVMIFIIGYLLIWPVYQYHIWNYPPEKQAEDFKFFLSAYPDFIQKPLIWAVEKPILRPYAQYLTGLLMVFHRAAFGHTTYFLGEISNLGWKNYFPIVYLIKEPLPLHILTLLAILYAAWLIKEPFWRSTFPRVKNWIKKHFPEFAMILFIGIYWAVSLTSNLNIGVRHLLPVFPFIMILVSAVTMNWLTSASKFGPGMRLKYLFLAVLILWQAISVLKIYPHFLAYFNELAQGPDNGYIYTVDSNLDWGQDLKRLEKWVAANKIDKIYVDYFGGGDAEYYLKEKFVPWWGQRNPAEFSKGNYLAVSATLLQGGRGNPVSGFDQPCGYYRWLDRYQPIEKIGYSIFIYYIE